jgi:ribonuclease HI
VKKVELTTDGACIGNPGPGGWACVLRFGGNRKELFGYDPQTTNNRMELMAPIQGLLALKEPCEVKVTTDSEYVLYGITRWIVRWKRIQWWRKQKPIANSDLWMELDHLASLHRTTWEWTRGHAGHEDNTRCDFLAQNAAARQRSSWEDGRPHAPLSLGLPAGYIPPKPQASLFGDPDEEDDDGEDEAPADLAS